MLQLNCAESGLASSRSIGNKDEKRMGKFNLVKKMDETEASDWVDWLNSGDNGLWVDNFRSKRP